LKSSTPPVLEKVDQPRTMDVTMDIGLPAFQAGSWQIQQIENASGKGRSGNNKIQTVYYEFRNSNNTFMSSITSSR